MESHDKDINAPADIARRLINATVGTLDPLLDDTLFMHSRWFASGNPSTLNVYPGATHGFERQPTQLAEKVKGRMRNFISESFQA